MFPNVRWMIMSALKLKPAAVTDDEARAALAAGKIVMCVMDRTGDIKTIWDPAKPVEVESARAQYTDMTTVKGYLAYHSNADGSRGEAMPVFDPKPGKVIFCPPIVGG